MRKSVIFQGTMKSFKQQFYIEQLKVLNVTEINGVPVDQLTDNELKHALMMARIKEGA